MIFCEINNPKMALKYYLLTEKLDDVVRLAFQLKDWDALISFLINFKNFNAWLTIIESEQVIDIFPILIKKSEDFFDSESASCLIKVLSAKNEHELLIQFVSALLCTNLKLKSSRSLQTIYLINLIQVVLFLPLFHLFSFFRINRMKLLSQFWISITIIMKK